MSNQLFELVLINVESASQRVHVQLNQVVVSGRMRQIEALTRCILNLQKAVKQTIEHVQFLSFEPRSVLFYHSIAFESNEFLCFLK